MIDDDDLRFFARFPSMRAYLDPDRRIMPSTRSVEPPDDIAMEAVVEHVAGGGTLRSYSAQYPYPTASALSRWIRAFPAFRERVAEARKIGAMLLAERALEVAMTTEDGEEVTEETGADGTVVAKKVKRADRLGHRRLVVETLLRVAQMQEPALASSKQHVTLAGDADAPLQVRALNDVEREERVRALLDKAMARIEAKPADPLPAPKPDAS